MSNFQIYNDKVWTFPLKCVSAAGVIQPSFPSGLTVTSSSPNSLGAAEVLGKLVLTPLVQASLGITVTISGAGLIPATLTCDIVSDPNALNVVIDMTAIDVTTVNQNVPTAPGP